MCEDSVRHRHLHLLRSAGVRADRDHLEHLSEDQAGAEQQEAVDRVHHEDCHCHRNMWVSRTGT